MEDGIFYDDVEMQKDIERWNSPICPRCQKRFASVPLLQAHLKVNHNQMFWFAKAVSLFIIVYSSSSTLCLEKRTLFLNEQRLYTPETILLHNQGTLPNDQGGHPLFAYFFSFVILIKF